MNGLDDAEFQWIESLGGPLLLLHDAILAAWRGSDHDADDGTDYDRACEVAGSLGVIPVGDGEGLVLGDEPLSTCWVPRDRTSFVARWMYAENVASVDAWLASVDPDSLEVVDPVVAFRLPGPCSLFDAVWPGAEVEESLPVLLSPGRYRVGTCHFQPDEHTHLVLHPFTRES